MPLIKKYLAQARDASASGMPRASWGQGAPSAAQQQHQPVLRKRCGVDVRDERCTDARKAHNELEIAQRGVLDIAEALMGVIEHHLQSLRTEVQAPPPPRPLFWCATAHLNYGIIHDPLDCGRVAEVGLFGRLGSLLPLLLCPLPVLGLLVQRRHAVFRVVLSTSQHDR